MKSVKFLTDPLSVDLNVRKRQAGAILAPRADEAGVRGLGRERPGPRGGHRPRRDRAARSPPPAGDRLPRRDGTDPRGSEEEQQRLRAPDLGGLLTPPHGIQGTVTLSEETLLGILMDTIGSLAEHGVKRFVFYSGHGGNSNILNLAMQMAKSHHNVMTFYPWGPSGSETARKMAELSAKYNDIHSGPIETAMILLHNPELAEMWRLEGWTPKFSIDPKLREFMDPDRPDYELVRQIRAASSEPDLDDYTSDGIAGINDPREADPEFYRKRFEERVQFYVDFIELWKTIPVPMVFRG
ncbi:MAG: creatininase family protein [Candidatus Bathyarchaeota archaeon]|nr:MAG: creatininase family protein [Candidatus Bathyarchaeota archaeon]